MYKAALVYLISNLSGFFVWKRRSIINGESQHMQPYHISIQNEWWGCSLPNPSNVQPVYFLLLFDSEINIKQKSTLKASTSINGPLFSIYERIWWMVSQSLPQPMDGCHPLYFSTMHISLAHINLISSLFSLTLFVFSLCLAYSLQDEPKY